jgi:TPR repeat protein
MSSVGLRGVGWFSVLAVVGCAATLQSARPPAKASVVSVEPTPGETPPLTPPPVATPELVFEVDVAQLMKAITAGTDVRIDPATFADLWQIPGMDFERPLMLLKSGVASDGMVFVSATRPGARFELAPAEPTLSARGLSPFKASSCVLREAGPGVPAVLCGKRQQLLTFAKALPAPNEGLPDGATARVSWRLGRALGKDLYDLRGAVPRNVDPLLPEKSALDQAPALRRALLELGFQAVDRLVEAYENLGPLSLSLSREQQGKLAVTATLQPSPASALGRAVAAARSVRVPDAFWELPERIDSAVVFDASLLAPMLEPSPRALALLSEARSAAPMVEDLTRLATSCLQPGLAIVVAAGPHSAAASKPATSGPPELREVPPREEPAVPRFSLFALEDKNGACYGALTGLLASHERLSVVSGAKEGQRHLSSLPSASPVPKDVKLLQIGSGKEPSYVGFAQRKGALWLGKSSDRAALEAALSELLAPPAKRRNLRRLPELVAFGKTPALVSGFVREDVLPFTDVWGKRKSRVALGLERPATDSQRLPFSLTRDDTGVHIAGQLEARSVRRAVVKMISDGWGNPELARLTGAKQTAALGLLEAACHLGEGNACNWLGVVYGDGRGVAKDTVRAARLLELGCQHGAGMACANLPFYKKLEKAEELAMFQKGCSLDAPFGCAWWGVRLLDSDKPEDQQQGLAQLQTGCDGFVGFACARIGSHYREGIGVKQDDAKSADFYERACQLSSGAGCVELAGAFVTGKGRPHDEPHAVELLKRGCQLEPGDGCYALGFAYLHGRGVAKDEAAALAQFNVACEANHAEACRMMAEMAGEP